MGNAIRTFHEDDKDLAWNVTHPNKADWITAHALKTGLAIVEVDRLWLRFEQLGCNEDGVLASEVLQRPPASNDIFIQNILRTFFKPSGVITFHAFLKAMKWAATSDINEKIKGVFYLLNNGQPVSRDALQQVIRKTYPEENEDSVANTTEVLMTTMDTDKKGSISQQDFMNWVYKLPLETVLDLLDFHIVPLAITEEAHRIFKDLPYDTPLNVQDVLRKIASQIHRRDWHMLGNRLGFTADELHAIERKYPVDGTAQVYEMLTEWRLRVPQMGQARALAHKLRECNMHDAALYLD